MKTLLVFIAIILQSLFVQSQIFSTDCMKAGIFLPDFPNCNNGDYYLIFEDEFDGNSLDLSKWNPVTGVPRDFSFSQQKAWHFSDNVEVSNGTMKIVAKKLPTPYVGTFVTDWSTNPFTTQTSSFDYSTGEIWSKESFFYGKFEIRCRLPNGKGFFPAFWMYGGQRWNEIDVFDNLEGNDEYSCGPGYDFDGDGQASGCRWSTNNIPDFSQWHTFTCIFDFDRIIWLIDDVVVRTLYRFSTITGSPILCGDDIAQGIYFQEESFPVESMHIILNLAIRSGEAAPDASTVFPNYYEVDYVRYYIKSAQPPCSGCLDHISFENTNDVPEVTRAENYIRAENNVIIKSGQRATFKSPVIQLLPGFSTENGSNFVAIPEECNIMNFESVPIEFLGSNAINNYQVIKCINPVYSIEVSGVTNYSFKAYNSIGALVFSTNGMPVSNHINLWNVLSVSEGSYRIVQDLTNCENSDNREYYLYVSNGNCNKTLSDSAFHEEFIPKVSSISIIDNLILYPNPSNEVVGVYFTANSTYHVRVLVFDVYGRELENKCIQTSTGQNSFLIDVSNFEKGVYFIQVFSGEEILKSKFIVE